MLPTAKEEMLVPFAPMVSSDERVFSLAAARVEGKTETLSKTRVRGFGEKIRPCIGATWQLSGNPRWGCEKSSWETVVGSALDANGNTSSDASGKSYFWDFENRLTQAVVPGVGTTTFRYDPWGRRIYKSSPNFTGVFLYDGLSLIETINAAGSEVVGYTHGAMIDEPLAETRAGTTDYYEADALGSITSISASAGTVANTYAYDSFGNSTYLTGSLRNPFGFTGREFDSETNLYFYRARYYDASLGRFISEDPLGFDGDGSDFYAYVQNSGVNLADPLGLCSSCHCGCKKCHTVRFLVTGYDNSYRSTGKNPGDPGYGITTSGKPTGHGTIAAPKRFPFGTGMYVPGYGCGTVQDHGGAIRGMHIDVWFATTQEALNWGNPRKNVEVCDDGH